MKSRKNIEEQRDMMIELGNMYINLLEKKIMNNCSDFQFSEYSHKIHNLINNAKILDWVLNTDDDNSYFEDYYDSDLERNINNRFNLEKLDSILALSMV